MKLPGVSVSSESIAAAGFYGQFWKPAAGTAPRPAVLVFGGSEGGLDDQMFGAALASAGYPTLDIAYFGEPGLPSTLKDIPLEYFARALRWLARYAGAGHSVNFLRPYEPASYPDFGDEDLPNLNADARLFPELLRFLANPAGQGGTFTAPSTPPLYSVAS
jgi:hypothetical protein